MGGGGNGRRPLRGSSPASSTSTELAAANATAVPALRRSVSLDKLANEVSWFAWRQLKPCEDDDHPPLRFDFVVGLSCLLYLFPACAYFTHGWPMMGLFFCLVTCTSVMADALFPTSKRVNELDRAVGVWGFCTSPFRFVFGATAHIEHRVFTALLLGGCLCVLGWSRRSKHFHQFVFRHTLWHLASAAALLWVALFESAGVHHLPLSTTLGLPRIL
mmetsp:Transcript_24155/g.78708  ORF Transcript_24155/g.78708 Transcript_24155/m.78708 type:complete len:217 (+) Transcript_24155:105-755(+)|eukprot:CAMPEP_0170144532 /NCGR_PEP_ID=MMETSP0033_2-20121228/14232_1 /TAXON_ID=195969 /ORGANISM="Dolichomastix tenuilepis, Strain CCMP3274" /LENGTH=216 /DNA_ID=CAMNT_0010381037 /DNA_START=104 /DNA_END=754 /DNA_ORIENTATION=+